MAANPDAIAAYASLLTPAQCGAALVFMPGSGAGLGSAARAHGRFLLDADALDGWLLGLLLPGADRFAALATPNYFLAAHLARHRPDLGIRYVAALDLTGWIAAQLPSRHRIGLIGGGEMPAWLLTGLQAALPQTTLAQAAWLALDTEAHRLRQAKAPRDLARHEAAAALCDHLFAAIPAFLVKQPGAPRLQELIRREAYDQGCNDCRSWISYGPMGSDADIMAPDPAQRLDSSTSSVTVGLMLTLDGAFGHAIRSYSLGPAPAALLAAHDALLAAGDRLFQGLRPAYAGSGNAGSGPNAAQHIATLGAEARAELAARGYPQGFAFRLGHALGYAYEDPPLSALFQQPFDRTSNHAVAAAPETLVAPSLFELHPSLQLPGLGLIAQGDMLLVEPEANRWALKTPRAIIPV
ncbi:M24 family metallopeptidase [Ferrovibrio sp.]|uniref:M24 family metallopeptidase n=1 Tax=Ferrovibrio sp. TaxID=1917215 RepID=UPI003D0AF9A8